MCSHEKDFFLLLPKRAQPILPPCFFSLSCPCICIYCNICIYTLKINSVYILYTYIHYVYAYMYICTHARTHTRTHARTHARTHTRTHARTHTHTHTLTYTLILKHTHTYISRARVCGPRPYTHTSVASKKTWTVYMQI
jgi:hypothetical protein